jgi:tRNA A-37 threonylcarbamoyl transferase component Bud32
VHAVLRHLEAVGFAGAPCVLGVDEQGREIVSYIEGRVIRDAAELSEPQLRSAAELIRRFHDATAGTELADGGEVVLHGDLGPHNTVFVGDRAVGLIDGTSTSVRARVSTTWDTRSGVSPTSAKAVARFPRKPVERG